ncbi:MAG: hypothetical protein ACTSRA_11545 [Promethearchaeota archaeon]
MGGYGSSYDYSTDDAVVKRSAKSYNIQLKREYKETRSAPPPPVGKVLVTKAKFPMVVAVDVTGSMREYPRMIFEKLCILYGEVIYFLPETLKDNFEISFAAVGDAYSDNYPIQVTDFASGHDLDLNIMSLYPEGGGGGQQRETYELVAYYYARKCQLLENLSRPKPLFIFIGDEAYYSKISRNHVMDYIGDNPRTDLISDSIFEELKQKFNVYILRIKYDEPDSEMHIDLKWRKILGDNHVILMEDPRRIVDAIIGLVATAVDEFSKFKERIEVRQTPKQVDQVYSSLNGIRAEEYNKTYVYKIEALQCPLCGDKLDDMPDYGHPVKCESCGYLIVRI